MGGNVLHVAAGGWLDGSYARHGTSCGAASTAAAAAVTLLPSSHLPLPPFICSPPSTGLGLRETQAVVNSQLETNPSLALATGDVIDLCVEPGAVGAPTLLRSPQAPVGLPPVAPVVVSTGGAVKVRGGGRVPGVPLCWQRLQLWRRACCVVPCLASLPAWTARPCWRCALAGAVCRSARYNLPRSAHPSLPCRAGRWPQRDAATWCRWPPSRQCACGPPTRSAARAAPPPRPGAQPTCIELRLTLPRKSSYTSTDRTPPQMHACLFSHHPVLRGGLAQRPPALCLAVTQPHKPNTHDAPRHLARRRSPAPAALLHPVLRQQRRRRRSAAAPSNLTRLPEARPLTPILAPKPLPPATP